VGVRLNGRMAGYVTSEDLVEEGDLRGFRSFAPAQVLAYTANLDSLFEPLSGHEIIFISVLGEITCAVTRDDLEKPPMRMWLFGIITLLEMNVTWAVQEIYPDNRWVDMISSSRLEKAQELQAERQRRKQNAGLLSCLQFSDKLEILGKEEINREFMNLKSRREARDLTKSLESLRNNLAHAQPVIGDSWEVILRLSSDIDKVVSAPGIRKLVEHVKACAEHS